MPIYREYSDLDDDDPVLKPGQTLRVPLRFVDNATRAQWNALHSAPIMCDAQQLHDGMGNAPGFKRGFVFGGDRSASEAAREARIAEMRDAWRNRQDEQRLLPDEQRTAADAYEEKCKRLANAWRQR
jgi:hypothetical protein